MNKKNLSLELYLIERVVEYIVEGDLNNEYLIMIKGFSKW